MTWLQELCSATMGGCNGLVHQLRAAPPDSARCISPTLLTSCSPYLECGQQRATVQGEEWGEKNTHGQHLSLCAFEPCAATLAVGAQMAGMSGTRERSEDRDRVTGAPVLHALRRQHGQHPTLHLPGRVARPDLNRRLATFVGNAGDIEVDAIVSCPAHREAGRQGARCACRQSASARTPDARCVRVHCARSACGRCKRACGAVDARRV